MDELSQGGDRSSTFSASLSIAGTRSGFAIATGWFEKFLDESNVSDEARADLMLVFEEVVVNVITHAYRGNEGTIEIAAARAPSSLTLTIRDDGPPFDPRSRAEPDLSAPLADREVGGLGVHLVKSLCDEIRYQRRGESNILVLVKNV